MPDHVDSVSFSAPPFISQDPSTWFSILECTFKASKITASLTKFVKASTVLPADVLSQVADVVSAASTSASPYEDLKAAVLQRLQSTVSSRLQELLSKEELGGEKPTDLLRRMKKLLGDKFTSFDKELFLQLFYQRLPPDTQRCLFTVKNKLSVDELATLADEFMATLPQGQPAAVASISAENSTKQLAELVSQLSLQVRDLQREVRERFCSRSRSSSRHDFRRRQRSKSKTPETSGFCYYHEEFGKDARNCKAPCSFAKSLNPNSEH